MSTNDSLKNALTNKPKNQLDAKKETMSLMLKKMSKEIEKALPSHLDSERFQRVALTAFNSNPKLQQCDPVSFIASMMQSAQLGVEPNTPLGQAYLIPYGNNVQFILSYKGMLDLAQRSGQFKTIYAHPVYENDEFEIEYGLETKLVHKPSFKSRGNTIGYYAVYKLINGGESFIFMPKEDILAHAKTKSKTFNNGPWQTDFDQMALKTVIKQLLKYAPMSVEVSQLISNDETIRKDVNSEPEIITAEFEIIDADGGIVDDKS